MQIIITILRKIGEIINRRRNKKEMRKARLEEIWNVLLNEDFWEDSSDDTFSFYPAVIFRKNCHRYYVSFDNLLVGGSNCWCVSLREKGHGEGELGDEIFRYNIRKRFFNKDCVENRIIDFWEKRKNRFQEMVVLKKQKKERHIKELEDNFLNKRPYLRVVKKNPA